MNNSGIDCFLNPLFGVSAPSRFVAKERTLDETKSRSKSLPPLSPSQGARSLSLSAVKGKEVTEANDVTGRYSLARRRKARDVDGTIALPFCPESKLPAYVEHGGRVLFFSAYYEEMVLCTSLEKHRVHPCEIEYYVEDDSLEIFRLKQENSGISHGKYLSRRRVIKPKEHCCGDGLELNYTLDDLKVGKCLLVNGRIFHIVGCAESTRKYVVERHGWTKADVDRKIIPLDTFAEAADERKKFEPLSGRSHFNEIQRDKSTPRVDRGMFLKYGQDALRFTAKWDDRNSLYGEVRLFQLVYFLADGTVEVIAMNDKSDGGDQFSKFLRRSRLPKHGSTLSTCENAEFYVWEDFVIGEIVSVFGRNMTVVGADEFTRQFFSSHGCPLVDNMSFCSEEKYVTIDHPLPPHNGFGSEKDFGR